MVYTEMQCFAFFKSSNRYLGGCWGGTGHAFLPALFAWARHCLWFSTDMHVDNYNFSEIGTKSSIVPESTLTHIDFPGQILFSLKNDWPIFGIWVQRRLGLATSIASFNLIWVWVSTHSHPWPTNLAENVGMCPRGTTEAVDAECYKPSEANNFSEYSAPN